MTKRPNPETLLRRIQQEERNHLRGKLKIYLGAAPGVGKTYSMLQDAAAKRTQGLDVVVGIVETHGRKDLEELVKNSDILPRQILEYRGQQLTEFDLDAALKRNPALILIDEMAHSNAPGLRHAKRWQDIKEILDRGIDVYTTLNVQHIESLNDIVVQIIHAQVKETVPDSMLELADTIELVDLPPEELLKRLHEGKVYIPKQAQLAVEHFFRQGNLTALRELALRVTAERVNAQVQLYREGFGIKHIWATTEKLLVCVGYRADSADIIRATKRLAASLQAEWIAIHVEVPRFQMSEEKRNSVISNLRLAEQLGAETKVLAGIDVVEEIMNFAREHNVTTIVVGKRIRSRWRGYFYRTLSDELVRYSGEIDVYIITPNPDASYESKKSQLTPVKKLAASWRIYLLSITTVGLITVMNYILFPYLSNSSFILMYLLGVAVVAIFGRKGPSYAASLLSVLCYDFFFVAPYYTLFPTDLQTFLTLVDMLFVGLVISYFVILSRRQAEAARLAEQYTATLHMLTRQLASTRGVDKLLATAVIYIAKIFDSEVWALMPNRDELKVRAKEGKDEELPPKEFGVAQWVYDLGQVAGLGTDTLPFSDSIYFPLLASKGALGVLRIHPNKPEHRFTPEQMHLLESCAHQVALAIEVDRLQENTKQLELQNKVDHARNALLQSVSHDLRTPLVAAMGSASTLIEMSKDLSAQDVKKLGRSVYRELEQLTRLIHNLLQMTYLEGGVIKLHRQPCDLSQLINGVIESFGKKLRNKPIHLDIMESMPLVRIDSVLMHEVLVNLIDNAIKFTPEGTDIEISIFIEFNKIIICVEDHGPGIVADEVKKLFEKFYRGRMLTTERGMGLGLAICHSIVKAHGGIIWAANRKEGGAMFCISLPLKK